MLTLWAGGSWEPLYLGLRVLAVGMTAVPFSEREGGFPPAAGGRWGGGEVCPLRVEEGGLERTQPNM